MPFKSFCKDMQDYGFGTFIFGVTSLEAKNLSSSNSYLAVSIPLGIIQSVKNIRFRTLSATEQYAILKDNLERNKLEKKKQLSSVIAKRDELIFSGDPGGKKKSDLDIQIDGIRKDLDELEASKLESSVKEHGRVVEARLAKENTAGMLIKPVSASVSGTADRENVDLLLSGTLEEIEGALFIEVFAFNRKLESRTAVYRKGFFPDSLSSVMEELSRAAAREVLGRDYSSLAVSVEQKKAEIFLDGSRIGSGNVSVPFLQPGDHEILVRLERHEEKRMALDLAAFESRLLNCPLLLLAALWLSLLSRGADVYVSSIWAGKHRSLTIF